MKNKAYRDLKVPMIALTLAAVFMLAALPFLTSGCFRGSAQDGGAGADVSEKAASNVLPEVEASEFEGTKLVPIRDQGNNAILGTRHIDRKNYKLNVTGLVNKDLAMSYDELLSLPAVSEAVYMPCVEGWGFMAKWTGFKVTDVLDKAGLLPEASFILFWSDDGYSTGLPLSYIRDNGIIMAYGLNDMTLPDDRGFPFQLVARSKYGYKWAKWITKIEALDHEVLGYWEQRGYSDAADVKNK